MNLRKRTLALLLTVCMLLSVAVPMVSAEVALTQQSVIVGTTNTSSKPYASHWEVFASTDAVTEKANHSGSYLRWNFNSTNSSNGDWVALKIKYEKGVQGTWTLGVMAAKPTSNNGLGGKSDVYFLQTPDASVTDKQAYITAGMTPENYLGEFNAYDEGVTKGFSNIVNVESDSFILVFKCAAGQESDCRLQFSRIWMVPAIECADAATLTEACTAIAEENGTLYRTIKLTDDITAGNITVPGKAVLNLNGHTLTVDSYTNNGKEVGTGSVQVGGQGGGTVTPPAGGEGGGTVTPPAGGEGGGADTPAQTGDTSPVLFAVVALAASLLAMVALIPNKKRA